MAQLAHRLDDDQDSATVPLVEERAVVRKRKRLTGGVRVRTVVHEDEQVIDETLRAEQVEVKRVPLDDRWVAAPVPVRHEGDTTIVTLHEEVIVVENGRWPPRRFISSGGRPLAAPASTSRCGARKRSSSA